MEHLFNALKNIVIAEKDAYRELLELSEKKREILIKNDVDALNRIIRDETSRVKALKPFTREREKLLLEIALMKGMEKSPGLADVISLADGRIHDELVLIKQEFYEVIQKLSLLNDINKKLIDTQMQYTSFCIEAMTQAEVTDTYNSTGTVADTTQKRIGLLDQKV